MSNDNVGILLGGNEEDTLQKMNTAIFMLAKYANSTVKLSSIFSSKSWGYQSEKKFYNQFILFSTSLEPIELLRKAMRIERTLGRQRKVEEGYSDRSIDIDLIFYEDLVITHPQLELPHPRMQERDFCLRPMAELLPDWQHPILKRKTIELLHRLSESEPSVKLKSEQ